MSDFETEGLADNEVDRLRVRVDPKSPVVVYVDVGWGLSVADDEPDCDADGRGVNDTDADDVTVFNPDVGTGDLEIVVLDDAHGEALSDDNDGVTWGENEIPVVVDTRTLRVSDALVLVENVRVPDPVTQREPTLDGVKESRKLPDGSDEVDTLTEKLGLDDGQLEVETLAEDDAEDVALPLPVALDDKQPLAVTEGLGETDAVERTVREIENVVDTDSDPELRVDDDTVGESVGLVDALRVAPGVLDTFSVALLWREIVGEPENVLLVVLETVENTVVDTFDEMVGLPLEDSHTLTDGDTESVLGAD